MQAGVGQAGAEGGLCFGPQDGADLVFSEGTRPICSATEVIRSRACSNPVTVSFSVGTRKSACIAAARSGSTGWTRTAATSRPLGKKYRGDLFPPRDLQVVRCFELGRDPQPRQRARHQIRALRQPFGEIAAKPARGHDQAEALLPAVKVKRTAGGGAVKDRDALFAAMPLRTYVQAALVAAEAD